MGFDSLCEEKKIFKIQQMNGASTLFSFVLTPGSDGYKDRYEDGYKFGLKGGYKYGYKGGYKDGYKGGYKDT